MCVYYETRKGVGRTIRGGKRGHRRRERKLSEVERKRAEMGHGGSGERDE